MYQIMKDGISVGFTENPNFVELLENGSYGLCEEAKSTGIAYEGTVYHLSGKSDMEGLETVMLIKVDAGSVTNAQALALQAVADELTNTQLALCSVYELLAGGESNG